MAKSKKKSSAAGPILAIIAVIVLLHSHIKPDSFGAVAAAVPVSGSYSCSQLESLWESAGGSSGVAFTMAEIGRAESSGNPTATDHDGNGSTDYGLWQINSTNGGSPASYSPAYCARQAVSIEQQYGFGAWSTYNNGAYSGQC